MKGNVIAVNIKKGFVAISTDDGITVFELLGGYDVEVGDVISGNLDALGGETFNNETQSEEMDVYVQGVHCTESNAKHLMV